VGCGSPIGYHPGMDLLTSLVLWLAFAAISLVALFYVVRAAVLSALRTHHAEVQAKPPVLTHLDQDGL
jgi:hypothetical protein